MPRPRVKFHGGCGIFYVNLTGSFCCDFDLYGIATGWGFPKLEITKNIPTNRHT